MKHAIVCLFVVFAASITGESFAQDRGHSAGVRVRGLKADGLNPYQTHSLTIKKHRPINGTRILIGVRRLVPQEYLTIQDGINAASNGDTVLVADGTYYENINFKGKAITVASHFIVDEDTNHISNTIINSFPLWPDSGSAVYFVSGEDTNSVLCGFTITEGTGTLWDWPNLGVWRSGGGIFCVGVAGATIINNHITKNRVAGENAAGGGIFFVGDQGFLILEGNHIFGNRASANPGIAWGGGMEVFGEGVFVRLVGNVFERDTSVAQNSASGGAIDLWALDSLADGVIRRNVFHENFSDAIASNGIGGGITLFHTAAIEVRNNLFEDNIARSSDAYGEGGALLIEDTQASGFGRKMVMGNRFISNMASIQSGSRASGGAIEVFNTLATISGNHLKQNISEGGNAIGGGINIYQTTCRLENNVFDKNTALDGGAVYVYGTPQSDSLDIINNTIVNNIAAGGAGINVSDVQPIVLNSILWGNVYDQIALTGSGSIQIRHSNIQGGWSGEGNINGDPLFADTVDYKLSGSSPCIGAGIDSIQIGGVWYHALPADIGGNPRPMPAGTMPDMGAWEDQITGLTEWHQSISSKYSLNQNYPNPFNPTTTIEFSLPQSGFVTIKVYDILGEEVTTLVSEKLNAGKYKYDWDAGDLASGVYLYRMVSGDFVQTSKMILMK